jgi:hypothetical protein
MSNIYIKQRKIHFTTTYRASFCLAIAYLRKAFSSTRLIGSALAILPIVISLHAWGFETDHNSQIGTESDPKSLAIYGNLKVGIGTDSQNDDNLVAKGNIRSMKDLVSGQNIWLPSTGWINDVIKVDADNINGRVGIGISNPSEKLDVNGTIKGHNLEIGDTVNGGNINGEIFIGGGTSANVGIHATNPEHPLHVRGNVRIEGNLTLTGNMTLNGRLNGTIASDSRLKKNVKPIKNSLQKLQQIEGVYFDWKDSTQMSQEGRQLGVIAQSVEAQFPELVVENGEGYKTVAYSQLSAVLIQAVNELKSKNDDLTSELGRLSERLKTLEAKQG